MIRKISWHRSSASVSAIPSAWTSRITLPKCRSYKARQAVASWARQRRTSSRSAAAAISSDSGADDRVRTIENITTSLEVRRAVILPQHQSHLDLDAQVRRRSTENRPEPGVEVARAQRQTAGHPEAAEHG